MDKFSNHIRNIMHGFFLSIGTTIAEPSTILPLIVNYFGGSSIVVGIFASLLRGGAIMVQMFAAFKAQSYPLMLPYLRRVFLVRFLAWFSIGVAIILLGETHPQLTLLCIGIGLFVFSFSAGFGAIYFKDIVAKIFSNKFRGKTMAYRQFFTAFAGLISGSFAAVILEMFEAPYNFGYLFVISSFFMGIGFLAFGSVDELLIGPADNCISHLILREGPLWGPKDITIPVEKIDRIEDGTVYLNISKSEVKSLPAVPIHRFWRKK